MPNSSLAFGIDLSRWNTSADGKQKVNFDTIANHQPEVTFIAMRSGVSWGYQDPWFAYYMAEAQRINRVRLAYHVLFPGENPVTQMDNFFKILGDIDFQKVPLVLDLELDHGQTVRRITDTTAEALNIIIKRTGTKPFIYSRASWVNQFLIVSELPPVYWWLAQYRWPRPYPLYTPEYPSPPSLPAGVTTSLHSSSWKIHQTANRAPSIGAPALYFMDYNRWNGTKADLLAFVGQQPNTGIECPIDSQPCPRIFV
jgi:GH25 family lysozyme M1 (1,4-beta-N-acetylmuramidase)